MYYIGVKKFWCRDSDRDCHFSFVHLLRRMEFLKFGLQSVKVRLDLVPPGNT